MVNLLVIEICHFPSQLLASAMHMYALSP